MTEEATPIIKARKHSETKMNLEQEIASKDVPPASHLGPNSESFYHLPGMLSKSESIVDQSIDYIRAPGSKHLSIGTKPSVNKSLQGDGKTLYTNHSNIKSMTYHLTQGTMWYRFWLYLSSNI